MKIRIIILTLTILIGLISCAKKNYVMCGLGSDLNLKTIDSEIIELKRIAIADTIIASISGKIYVKSIRKNDTIIENFPFVNVSLKNTLTDSIIGTTTDSNGKYQIIISASEYDITVNFIGHNSLTIRNVKIGTGNIMKFSANIGEGNGKTEYNWVSNNSFEKITK